MKISYNWLKEFLKIDLDETKVAEILTDLGLEVEGIEYFESVKGGLQGVLVGEVINCEQHPNADRLKLTQVELGDGSPVQIVCGAPNVAVGQKVPVATVGTKLYTSEGEVFTIKKGKIRGELSHGMICAEDELGLGSSHDGIMVLDKSLVPGTPAAEVFEIYTDQVFEIGLTPNRADAMSHLGVARDLYAGLLQMKKYKKKFDTPSVSDFHVDERTRNTKIQVDDPNQVPRYAGITITDLTIAESPAWLKNKLKALGLKPINNVVDITNYILHGLGQPLHAFDADQIKGDKIWVKNLSTGTKFLSLDGIERELHEDDIMICDGESNPLCIGGVFGGLHSGVTENTKTIFLESAYFNPVSIRKTAKRHGLNTDASFRFERGIDPNTVVYALKRAAIWISEIANGKIVSEITDIYPNMIEPFQVSLSYDRAFRLIGEEISTDTIKNILASLDIKISHQTTSGLGLTIPPYRVDVQREADIVEEILRVYGYNNISIPEKINTSVSSSDKWSVERIENVAATYLSSNGMYEAMNNSLTKPEYVSDIESIRSDSNVTMLNALSSDLSVMRQSMLFGLLESVSYNLNRKKNDVQLFEFGNTYHRYNEDYIEEKHLSLMVTGKKAASYWAEEGGATDIFYVKGLIKALLERLGIKGLKYVEVKSSVFAEGVALSLGKTRLVEFGILKKEILKQFGIKQEVIFADFFWDQVIAHTGKSRIVVSELPKYPEVKRDLALLIDESIKFIDLYNYAFQAERKFLKSVDLFDVYTGDKLPEGKRSYALSFVLQDATKTLTDKQIDKIMNKLQQGFGKQFGAEIR